LWEKQPINVRYQHTVKPISDLGGIRLMKSSEKLAMERELEIVTGLGYIYSPQPGDSEEEIYIKNKRYRQLESVNTDWLKELSRVAQVKDLQLSMSGGTDDTRYYLSTSYYDEQGGYDNSWANRFTSRFNLDHNFNHDVSIGFDSSVGRSKRSKSTTSPASLIYTLQPYETGRTTDFIARNPIEVSDQYFEDPYDELDGRYSELTSWRVDLNSKLNWMATDDLSLNVKGGLPTMMAKITMSLCPIEWLNRPESSKGEGTYAKKRVQIVYLKVKRRH
jgi:hypothetical protein